jgi:DeoR family transcriptional regulator, fructose operon transcriptional repressor
MIIAERKSRLRELIAERGISDLDSLASELRVSTATVRRDIQSLEQEGAVKRTHGGVIWVSDRNEPGSRPYAFDQRMAYQVEAKRQIARAAKSLIHQGETILIDGGTTTFYLAQELVGSTLQIVTNSLPIANLFLNDDNVELVLTGGLLYPRYGVLLGPTAEQMLSSIHVKTMFLSVAGLCDDSLYNQNLLLVQAEQRMMKQSQRIILLVDSTKFGLQALCRLCALDQINTIVVDEQAPAKVRQMITAAGCELIVAA